MASITALPILNSHRNYSANLDSFFVGVGCFRAEIGCPPKGRCTATNYGPYDASSGDGVFAFMGTHSDEHFKYASPHLKLCLTIAGVYASSVNNLFLPKGRIN